MHSAEERVAQIVSGVLRQAMNDAGAEAPHPNGGNASGLLVIERWCGVRWGAAGPALSVSGANKTELLLATDIPSSDIYPLGDLYASQLKSWGLAGIHPEVEALARLAGSIEGLDAVLTKLLDERRPADAAFADLPHIRDAVMTRLQKTRFRRAHMVVPKLGSRTIGIDLHI